LLSLVNYFSNFFQIQNNACSDAANSGALAGGVAQCQTQEAACNAAASLSTTQAAAPSSTTQAAAPSSTAGAALDFGTCTDPSIEFTTGLPGRDTAAFIASNQADFNHGSALNIGVIAQFICGQLSSACKAGADAISACATAEQAAGKEFSLSDQI
jgi:hypothetical protein